MTPVKRQQYLHLVKGAGTYVSAEHDAEDALALRLEAANAELLFGQNPYSLFLKKHEARPDRAQAATIGKLMGTRVRANDGSMQPPLSKAEKEEARAIRKRRRDWARKSELAWQVRSTLDTLCSVPIGGEKIVSTDLCTTEIREKLAVALEFLTRLDSELTRHAEAQSAKISHQAG